jgi:peroxiredoxin
VQTHPEPLAIGSRAPTFDLPATDGRSYRLEDFDAPVLIFIQGCNHCPVVLAYLDRIAEIEADYRERGVQVVMVNSNDAERYPDDGFGAMQSFAAERGFAFPYLFDADQSVAQAYRTFRTPEILVFDGERRLRYHGRIDDNTKEPELATRQDLREALDALLAGNDVPEPETYAVGCTVKWKPGNEPVLS